MSDDTSRIVEGLSAVERALTAHTSAQSIEIRRLEQLMERNQDEIRRELDRISREKASAESVEHLRRDIESLRREFDEDITALRNGDIADLKGSRSYVLRKVGDWLIPLALGGAVFGGGYAAIRSYIEGDPPPPPPKAEAPAGD